MAASPGSASSHEGVPRPPGNTGICVVYVFPFEPFIPVTPPSPDQSVRLTSVGPSVRLLCAPLFFFWLPHNEAYRIPGGALRVRFLWVKNGNELP